MATAGPVADQDAAPPGKRASRSVAAALVLTALLVVLVLSLAGQFVWQTRKDERAAVQARAASAAYVASAHARWLMEANLQALRRIDESLGARPDLRGGGSVRDLDTAVGALPGAVHVWVFDADGNSVLTDEPELAPVSIAGRDYFQVLKDGAEWHVGALVSGRRTARKMFPIGRRIERGGQFLGAAIIYVPADLLAQFWRSMDLGPGSTVGLLRDDGWLVARFPVPEQTLNLANYVLFTEHLPKASEGSYEAGTSPADGQARIVGYRRVDGLPLVTVVGIPTAVLTEGFLSRLGQMALVAAPIMAALLLVSLWVVKLLRQEERAREALARALEENRMLLREVHHRVKNNLQTVSALIQIQPGDPEGKDELMRRIAAMTAMHEHIYGSDQFGQLDIADYIRRLVAGLCDGYGSAVKVRCDLEPIKVGVDQALPLGLIVNEVVSNAFKHAFPDGRPGTITVTLKAEEGGHAVLRVRDDGVGFRPGRRVGMGSRLIQGLVRQIEGNCEYQDDHGTVFVLNFPLAGLPAGRAGGPGPGATERAA